ncbi:MAG: hypothetical protein J7M03_06850 [Candidatus Desulfofervidaceae bacterium]|nr:hypothetical protein [Candidatus Desulfofervidaceae bacterium]
MTTVIFRINGKGILEIKRGSSFKSCSCPKISDFAFCSDDCPLFGEPEEVDIAMGVHDKIQKYIKLELCENKTLYCKKAEFKDERR